MNFPGLSRRLAEEQPGEVTVSRLTKWPSREQVINYINQNPGVGVGQVASALVGPFRNADEKRLAITRVSSIFSAMIRAKEPQIKRRKLDGGWRYYPSNFGIVINPTDGRTQVEKALEALANNPHGLTLTDLMKVLDRNRTKANSQMHYMASKGMVERDGLFWKLPSTSTPVAKPPVAKQKVNSPKPLDIESLAKDFVWEMTLNGTPDKITLAGFVEWSKRD